MSACEGSLFTSLEASGDLALVETRVVECYANIIRFFNDSTEVHRAVAHCRRWIGSRRQHLRKETARVLLPALINAQAVKPELVDFFDELIRIGRGTGPFSKDDREIAQIALSVLPSVCTISSVSLLRLLRSGLDLASEQWDAMGSFGAQAVRLSVQKNHLDYPELCALASRLSKHVLSQEPDILTNRSRESEHLLLCDTLRVVQGPIDIHRPLRPKCRHVVNSHDPIVVTITFAGGEIAQPVTAYLGNFSVLNATWKPGAWVTSPDNGCLSGVSGDCWRTARLNIDVGAGLLIVLEAVRVKGPIAQQLGDNTYGHPYGFRVQFGQLTPDNRTRLERLAAQFPVTR